MITPDRLRTPLAAILATTLLLFTALACTTGTDPVASISADEFLSKPPANAFLLDVRTPAEFEAGRVPGATNVPHSEVAARLDELPTDKSTPIVVYCKSGRRAGFAADTLAEAGYTNLHHLEGDMNGWLAAGRAVETD